MTTNLMGLLRERVTLLTPTAVSNGAGGRTSTWAAVGQAYAVVGDMAGAVQGLEGLLGEQPIGATLARILLDTRETNIAAQHRVQTADGTLYEVLRINRNKTFAEIVGRRI